MDSVNYRHAPLDASTLLRDVTRLYVRAQRDTVACCGPGTAARCHVLGELARSGPLRLTDLATQLGANKSWTSRAVASMTAEGLLACVSSDGDGRIVNVKLTRRGEKTWHEMDVALRRHAQEALERLTPDDRVLVQRALALLREVLDHTTCCAAPLAGTGSRGSPSARRRRRR